MATNNLEVKFKVETSDLRKGSSDAKRTVKDTADQMARDVNGAAQNMSSSMGKVNDATKQIADAANTASNGVRNLENNVERSAANMERSLSRVSRQMSAMQMFHMGSRAVEMLGGFATNIIKLSGGSKEWKESAIEDVQTVKSVALGTLQGASMGTNFGPWGTVIGGLIGAGIALTEAAVKQKEAAEKQLGEYEKTANQIDTANQERLRQRSIQDMANMPDTQFDYKTAENQIQAARERYETAQSNLNASLDMAYGRNGYRTALDLQKTVTAIMKGVRNGAPYPWSEGFSDTIARFYSFGPGTYDLGVINWFGKGGLLEALSNRQNIDYALDSLDIKDLEDFTPIEKGEDWDKVFPRGTLGATGGFFKWFGDMLSANIVNAQKELDEATKEYQMYAPLEARLAKFNADSEARMRAPLPFDEDSMPVYYGADVTQEPRYWTEPVDKVDKEALAAGTQKLKDLTSLLNGVVKGTGFSSPTDALTRIGGGRGYASYNDSAASVQKNIEANLKTLIKNQTEQNADILHAIENIGLNENAIEWQEDN